MIDQLISELVAYGLENGLIDDADKVYVTNGLLELFQRQDYQEPEKLGKPRKLQLILDDLLEFALSQGILEDDTVTMRDLFDTKIMGILTPAPSVVRKIFEEKYQVSPKAATEFYYHFSQATNYIRTDRIIKDEKWETDTEFGKMDITINLSKPEKIQGILQKMELQKNLDTRRACFAGKTKGMQVTSHIQQDKTTGLYQLLCVENSIIYSIHHMYIIMSIALYLTRIIFRWRLMR